MDDRDPRVDADYVQGGVEASTLTLTALDVMTCCDFFQKLRRLDATMEDKGSNPRYIKARSMSVCAGDEKDMVRSPGGEDL